MKPSKKDFVAEAEEILESLGSSVLELQDDANPDTLNSIFRGFHTLKGLSGLFGLKNLTDLCHSLESLLDDLRLGEISIKEDTVDFILSNIDIIKTQISHITEDRDVEDLSGVIQDIGIYRESSKMQEGEEPADDTGVSPDILKVLSQYEEHRLKTNIKEGKGIFLVRAIFTLDEFAPKLEALNASMKGLGEIIATLPNSENVPGGSIGFKLLTGTALGIEDLREKLSISDIEQIVSPKTEEHSRIPARTAKSDVSVSSVNTVRVNIEKLDRILNTVGELVMAKGAISRIVGELTQSMGYNSLTIDAYKASQSIDRRLRDLQAAILDLRMVPFSQLFAKLAQVVRRHTRETNKLIDLKLFGEDTEIDKQIAEDISDPLIHIIRNSIDHGIEPRKRRLELGKSEKGTVILRAFSKGNNVVVEIQDDGAGLDSEKILSKAIEKGLIHESHSLDEKDIYNLIFLPGLSTKDSITEISGRGVGMDIVKDRIVALGGLVNIETERNIGTTFILKLPITLAIVKALIIKVADTVFAIPLTSISETFVIRPEKIQTIEGREVVELRNEMLPLLRLATVYQLEERSQEEYYGVVVGIGDRKLGLVVDALLEQTEVIIKPLGETLKDIPGLSGAAEIGRHEIVFVVDIEAMMEELFLMKKSGVKGA